MTATSATSTRAVSPPGARALLLAGICALWPALLLEPSGTSMSDSVLLASMRLVDAGTFALDEARPERVQRLIAFDISAGTDGRAYSGVGPGATLIAAPVYALTRPIIDALPELRDPRTERVYRRNARALGEEPSHHHRRIRWLHVLTTLCVITPLSASLVYRALNLYPGLSSRTVIAATLGALPFYYWGLYGRGTLASLLVWHAWLTLRGTSPSRRTQLMGGSLLGVSLTVDYPSALAITATLGFIGFRWSWRDAVWTAVPVLIAGVGLAVYHEAVFGSPWETPYSHRFWLAPESGDVDLRRFEDGGYVGLNPPSPVVAMRLLIGTAKGLLFHAPVALVGAWGLWRSGAPRAYFALLLAAVYVVFNSMLGTHLPTEQAQMIWGGLPVHWGPRHVLLVVSPLALGCAWLPGRAVTAVVGLSVMLNAVAAMFSHRLLEEPAASAALQFPAQFLVRAFLHEGPRVPLLEALEVTALVQLTVLLAMTAATGFAAAALRRADQSQKQTVL